MKTTSLVALFTIFCLVLFVNLGLAAAAGEGHAGGAGQGGPGVHSVDSDWAFEFGRQVATYGV